MRSLLCALIVLAVPGGCITEPIVTGRFELYNRSTETLIIRAEHDGELMVESCETLVRDDFHLNSVNGSAQSGSQVGAFEYGVDAGPLIVLVTQDRTELLASSPTILPDCADDASP